MNPDQIQTILKRYQTGELDSERDESGAGGFWDLAGLIAQLKDDELQDAIYTAIKEAAGLYGGDNQ